MFTVTLILLIIKLIRKMLTDDEIASQLKIRKGTKRHKEFIRLVRVLRKSIKNDKGTLQPLSDSELDRELEKANLNLAAVKNTLKKKAFDAGLDLS